MFDSYLKEYRRKAFQANLQILQIQSHVAYSANFAIIFAKRAEFLEYVGFYRWIWYLVIESLLLYLNVNYIVTHHFDS